MTRDEAADLKSGDAVTHKTGDTGEVLRVEGDHVHVRDHLGAERCWLIANTEAPS